jgi:hypothetical protein
MLRTSFPTTDHEIGHRCTKKDADDCRRIFMAMASEAVETGILTVEKA